MLPEQVVDRQAFKDCKACGLRYQASLSHGMVDCVAEFRYQIERLYKELAIARQRANIAEATVRDVKAALNAWEGI